MTNLEKKYMKQYEIGFSIFNKLFQLNKEYFIKVMKYIFQENKTIIKILEEKPMVVKTSINDEPEKIKICFYDCIIVNYTGVLFKPEHGQSQIILKFDKFFNIDIALNILSNEE